MGEEGEIGFPLHWSGVGQTYKDNIIRLFFSARSTPLLDMQLSISTKGSISSEASNPDESFFTRELPHAPLFQNLERDLNNTV